MGQTLIVKRQPSETDLGGSRNLVWGPTNRSAIKEGSKVINHTWVNKYARSLPQNIHVGTLLFVASDNLLKLFQNQLCQQSSEFID